MFTCTAITILGSLTYIHGSPGLSARVGEIAGVNQE